MHANDTNRGVIFFAVIVAIAAVAGFVFSFRIANAQLPAEAGLGQTCGPNASCEDRFYCSGEKCVQCIDDLECSPSRGEFCVNNVCTLPGGNNIGDSCVKDGNCKSGLICGARGVCEEVGGWKNALNYSCRDTQDCAAGLLCGPNSKRCVECFGPNNCDASQGEVSACDEGVCVYKGGNADGAWCAKDTHCASGKCGDNNKCIAAAGPAPGESGGGEWDWTGINLTIQDVGNIINGLACWLTRIAAAIMVIFLVLAGLRFMNARGNSSKFTDAGKNFQHVLIGILVIMAVYVIIATVAHAVGRTDFSLIPLVC